MSVFAVITTIETMGFNLGLLTGKKATASSEAGKTHHLFDQDLLLTNYLNRYQIDSYILFIKKGNSYLLASQKGYVSSDVDGIKFSDENLLIDFLQHTDTIMTLEDLQKYYTESVLIPKHMNLTLKMERQLIENLNVSHLVPFFN